ncbi:MAG: asparagine synthase (glutamine-hydrolyzing) [Phycisphaerales bacterium]
MCGIAGFITASPLDERTLEDVGASIAHRGPDDSGIWRTEAGDAHVALVHRRLSIIGLDDGHQPMTSADGRLTIVYNGELYNFPELRTNLEAAGVTFRTRCDTEALLHLYERHGPGMVHHLRGMFAFAIWDDREQTLFCARDHLGQKPFFFVYDEAAGTFAFASEIKALLASGLVDAEVDTDTLWHHTGLRLCPNDSTLFAGIRKLGPAQRATYDARARALRVDRYWTLDHRDKADWSFEESLDRLETVLDDSVRAHLLADVPTGSFLSGGIDSSTVAALAVRHAGKGWPTFSIGVGDPDYSELPAARLASEIIGSAHHEERVDPDLFLMLPDLVWHMEEPGDPHAVGIWLLSQSARRHVKVALGGDGGDEAFAGYTRYHDPAVLTAYALIPAFLRATLFRPLIGLIPQGFSYYTLASKARWAHDMSMVSGAARQTLAMTYFRFPEAERERLFEPAALAGVRDRDSSRLIAPWFDADSCVTDLDRKTYAEQMTRMPEHYLVVADRMSMAHSLEVRAPIVDREVMSFAACLPDECRVAHGSTKRVLRELCRRFYPAEFVDRKKYGFAFPMARWFAGELGPFVERVIADGGVFDAGLIRRSRAEELLAEHQAKKADHNFRLWYLINLEVWHQLFVRGCAREDVRAWLAERLGRESSNAELVGGAA